MIDRRSLLGQAGILALALGAPATAVVASNREDARLAALLQRHVDLFLARCPEEATSSGFDTGANAALRGRLTDRSLAAMATDRTAVKAAVEAARRNRRGGPVAPRPRGP